MIIKKMFPLRLRIMMASLFFIMAHVSAKAELLLPKQEQQVPQAFTVKGKILNGANQQPIPGVSVIIKGTTSGTVSDINGDYTVAVPDENSTLVFSYIGYVTQEIKVGGKGILDITLTENIAELGEIVVVGYRSQKGATISGAVSPIDVASLESRRVPVISQALQGRVAGVQVTQSTGAPGDEVEIRIRGNGTIGNNNPLYIIDGIPSREISFLNPADISSMTVLKDAAAASIYGSRASAGVVVITTKIGGAGRGLQVNYFGGVQKVANLPTMLNARQYMDKVEEAWNNAGYPGDNPYTLDKSRTDFADTDWLDELFEIGQTHNLQLSTQGGNDKTKYFISGGYYGQNGIVVFDNDRFQRFNFRTNLHSEINDRIKVGSNLQVSYTVQDKISSSGDAPGIIRHAFLRPPIIPVYKSPSDPTYSPENPFTDLPFYKGPSDYQSNKYELSQNPVALAYFTDDKIKQFKIFGNVFAEYSLLKDHSLKFRTNLGANINFLHNKTFSPNFGDDDGGGGSIDSGLGRQNRPNGLSEMRGQDIAITWNNTLNYEKTIGDHYLSGLVGTEFINSSASFMNASRQRFGFTDPNFRYLDFGGTELDLWNGGIGEEWALFSLFASVTYVNQEKYMLTANLRGDASSRFAENNKWGYFPSISAGWLISEEEFLKNSDLISELKLRGSWGELGNQEIPNYAYLTLFRRDAGRYLISRYGNPDLKWETTAQTNIGADIGLFRNKLFLSMDYFKKITSDILLPILLPQLVGEVSPTFVNAGQVTNKGFELAISYRNQENPFKYHVSGNLATLKNRVDKLHPNLPSLIGQVTRTEAGHPLNAYYGFVQEGIYQNEEEITDHLFGSPNPPQVPGDIKFRDLDGNGIINDNDRDFIGNPNPRLIYGLTMGGSFKGFDISFLFQGVSGVERYNDLKKIIDYDTRPFNYSDRVLGSWNGEGSTNTIPRVSFTDNGSSRVSSIFVEDASYLRLKNLEIGYSFGEGKFRGIGDLRFYASGQNLLTWTKYTGLDPESTALIDQGTYPQSVTVLLGVNVSF